MPGKGRRGTAGNENRLTIRQNGTGSRYMKAFPPGPMPSLRSLLGSFLIGIAVVLSPSAVLAELGGDEASVHADRVSLQATVTTRAARGFKVYEIETPSGTLIKEYTTQEGKVFAVTWQGPVLPNMRRILGNYFDRYRDAVAQRPFRANSPVSVRQDDLVIQSAGRMRSFVGSAYLPRMVPPEISIDALE